MDLFKLVATLGLDSSGFSTGIVAASDLFNSFASSVINFSRDVMTTGLGFDQAMADVQSVLGEQEGTVENMNRLRSFALDQAKDSIFTAEQTGEAYYYMGMAGWKAEQMLSGLPGVMALAAASGESLGTVSDIVTDSLTAFGLTAEDTSRYVDILAQAATNSNTNVAMMGETFKYAAPLAGAMGFEVEDVAVAIGLMANAGIKGSQAGTTLRRVFTALTGEVKIAGENLGEVTIQTKNTDGSMRDLSDIIADMRAAFSQLSESEKTSAADTIAGKYALSGFLALMNAGEGDVEKLTEAIDNAGGAAQRMADVRLDSLAGDIDSLLSSFDILKVAIYDDVKGPMREVVQWAAGALDDITNAINENGLAGGIDVLGEKIEEAGEKFAPLLESIGQAAGPLINAMFDTLLPRVAEAGAELGAGLLKGIGDTMLQGDNPLGLLVGATGYGLDLVTMVTGWLKSAGEKGGAAMMTEVNTAADAYMTENPLPMNDWLTAGYDPMLIPDGLYSATEEKSSDITDILNATLASAGTDGGRQLADNAAGKVSDKAPSIRDTLAGVLSEAGDTIGTAIADAIGDNLAERTYSINVRTNVTGLPTQYNASAMNTGRIFKRPTIFGYAEGAYQVAGDAGAEAVVGVNSLEGMIRNAVASAMSGAYANASAGQEFEVPRAGTGQPVTLDIRLMLKETEIGRALVPYIDAEHQRYGVSLAGGVY